MILFSNHIPPMFLNINFNNAQLEQANSIKYLQ